MDRGLSRRSSSVTLRAAFVERDAVGHLARPVDNQAEELSLQRLPEPPVLRRELVAARSAKSLVASDPFKPIR